jgi:hypothetical protein
LGAAVVVFAWSLDLQLPVQSVPIITKVVSSNPTNDEVYSIQHYVIKFVSDLRQVGGFLRVLGFPLSIKLTIKEMMIRDKKREMNWFCSQLPVGYRRWMLYRLVRSYLSYLFNPSRKKISVNIILLWKLLITDQVRNKPKTQIFIWIDPRGCFSTQLSFKVDMEMWLHQKITPLYLCLCGHRGIHIHAYKIIFPLN